MLAQTTFSKCLKKAGTRFFPFLFSFFHPSIACFLFYVLVFHFLSFCCMFYLELCSHFLFCIFVLAIHFFWLHLIMFLWLHLIMFLWLHLIMFLWLQLVSSPRVNKAFCHLETSFKNGACFFGCDWFIDLASTRVISILNHLSNLSFLPSNGFFVFASMTITLTGVKCK